MLILSRYQVFAQSHSSRTMKNIYTSTSTSLLDFQFLIKGTKLRHTTSYSQNEWSQLHNSSHSSHTGYILQFFHETGAPGKVSAGQYHLNILQETLKSQFSQYLKFAKCLILWGRLYPLIHIGYSALKSHLVLVQWSMCIEVFFGLCKVLYHLSKSLIIKFSLKS